MSSEKETYPNQGINQINSEVRLAYYVYTWDSTGKTKQKTAWSTIGTYTLNEYNDIVYTANKNQLIKTNGSNGVSVVGDNFGVIVNDGSDVGPSILKIDGKYITALDNLSNIDYTFLHREISTVDPHYIISNDLNEFDITYTDLWGESTSYNIYSSGDSYFPFTSYSKNTVVEPVELAVVGKDSHGINAITNKGFIYNNIEYQRNINIMNYYTELWNYLKNWQYGSNVYSVENYGDSSMEFASSSTSISASVTALNDFDISVIQNYSNIFKQCYDNNSNIADVNSNVQALSEASGFLLDIVDKIDELMGNKNDDGSTATEIPLNIELFNSGIAALQTWETTKNLTNLWENQHTAIVMEKLPINSTFMYFSQISNATSIVGMNNKTKEWIDLTLPVSDQSYEIIMRNVVGNVPRKYTLADMRYFLNNYSISYGPSGEILSTSSNVVDILTSQTTSNSLDVTMSTTMFIINDDNSFTWTSNVYFLQENNLNNSGSTFRFIGLESTGKPYSNAEGSNSIKITGFNKILLNDLYENPNTYQNADITYYYSDSEGITGSTTNVLEINGNLTSYSVSLVSAIQKDQNVLIGGCGSDGYEHTTGSPGVFYIPLPSEIDRDDDNAYVDTHWMLTTWTPNILNNATAKGINNNQNVLYKYTKMNDLITTGLYGGFTPYYNPASDITAGLLRIPQISYGTSSYGSPIYVTSSENKMAKLSMIMYNSDADGVTFPDDLDYIPLYNGNEIALGGSTGKAIGNIAPEYESDSADSSEFYNYFNTYKQYAACVFTLNSNEREIILNTAMMNNSHSIGNVAYLDLIGYPDEEFDNLSFDVERKYIFTFNTHIQVTNLNLLSDQINYGVPSLLLIGHFRNRYCKSTLKTDGTNILYPGRDVFIPLLNKPLENPVNNIYNIEGTYTLSWNTTGSGGEFNNVTGYQMYIPKSGKSYNTTGETFGQAWQDVFGEQFDGGQTIADKPLGNGNILHFENVLDRIYAFILTGETVNNNLVYQFVNNTTYQNGDLKLLSGDDLDLITGNVANNNSITTFGTSASYDSDNSKVTITIGSGKEGTITCTLNDEKKFVNTNATIDNGNAETTKMIAGVSSDGNSMLIRFESKENKQSNLVGVEITVSLNLNSEGGITGVSVYDNHVLFALENTGIDSGILGINEPMLSMTIQRY